MLDGLKNKVSGFKEADQQRYRRYLKNELEAVQLYRDLAGVERNEERAGLFRRLAQAEMRHVRIWSPQTGTGRPIARQLPAKSARDTAAHCCQSSRHPSRHADDYEI